MAIRIPVAIAILLLAAGAGAASADELPNHFTLQQAIMFGLTHNRSILIAENQRVAQRAQLRLAEDKFNPKPNIIALYSATKVFSHSRVDPDWTTTGTQAAVGPTVDMVLPTGTIVSVSATAGRDTTTANGIDADSGIVDLALTVRQPLLRDAGIDVNLASVRQARFQEEANKLELRFLVSRAITEIILAYREVTRSRLAVEIAAKSLARSRQIESDTRKLIAAGRIAASDIILSQSSVYQQEIGLLGARNDAEKAMINLLTIIGADLADTAAPAVNGKAAYKQFNLPRSVAQALDANPQVTAQNFRIEAARKDLEIASNQTEWDLSLVGGVGFLRTGPEFDNRDNRTELTGGVQLTIPLNNLAAETRETQAAVALKDAQLQFAEIRVTVQQTVRNAINDAEVKWKQYELSQHVRQSALGALDAARKRLALGRATNFEVQSLEDELRAAEIAELDAMIDYQNALAQADLAIGTTMNTWGINL